MTLNEYQALAQRTSNTNGGNQLLNGVLGLNGEAGEVADIVKKTIFQGHKLDAEHLVEEAGDCLWYVAEIATALGVTLDAVAEMNIQKLKKRYPDGFEVERSVNRPQ